MESAKHQLRTRGFLLSWLSLLQVLTLIFDEVHRYQWPLSGSQSMAGDQFCTETSLVLVTMLLPKLQVDDFESTVAAGVIPVGTGKHYLLLVVAAAHTPGDLHIPILEERMDLHKRHAGVLIVAAAAAAAVDDRDTKVEDATTAVELGIHSVVETVVTAEVGHNIVEEVGTDIEGKTVPAASAGDLVEGFVVVAAVVAAIHSKLVVFVVD